MEPKQMILKPSIVMVPLVFSLCVSAFGQESEKTIGEKATDSIVERYRSAAIERWDADISKLEKLDQTENYPRDAILFIGSSSIRRWETIKEDMSPYIPIRRGYGGARFSDMAIFVDRLVTPHDPRAIVIFVANDISGSERDKKPGEVLALYGYIVGRIQKAKPGVPVFCIAVTPTSSRFDVWPQIKKVNQLISKFSDERDGLHFIATDEAFLNKDGKPRDEYFVKDLLHLNEDGYDLWAKLIKDKLDETLVDSAQQ